MDIQEWIIIILFFPILFLIGFGFSLLIRIPQVLQFLLRSPKSRRAGPLLLAIFPFLTCFILCSRMVAEAWLLVIEMACNNQMSGWYYSSQVEWDWVIQNNTSIINEYWIGSLIPALPKEICFSSDPMVCEFVELFGRPTLDYFAIIFTFALIPAIVTFGFGRRFIRKKHQLPPANHSP